MDIRELVKKYEQDIINDTIELSSIRSVEEEPKEGMPFGEGPAKALQKALEIGDKYGFVTKNLDNYAGYIEMGEGEDIIGMLCHVDVVPEGIGWTSDPYKPEIRDGRIYGRGVGDNKGPAMVALAAMRAVRELGVPLNKRIRFVLGANEETGFKCVKYYREKEGGFTMGFSPDGAFPLVFGEKGLYNATLTITLNGEKPKTVIESITGGEARNVVCPVCSAVLSGENLDTIKEAFEKYNGGNEAVKTKAEMNDGKLTLELTGRPSHGSAPQFGVNSIAYMVDFLKDYITDSPFVNMYTNLIGLCVDGEKCGAKSGDKYGDLTMNIGIVYTNENKATFTIDIRYPILAEFPQEVMENNFRNAGCEIELGKCDKPLFVDPDSDFIKALHSSYVEVTGDTKSQPFTMGGGTYAKAFDNVVAFGMGFPGDSGGNAHMADESISIARLTDGCEVYVRALLKLLEL